MNRLDNKPKEMIIPSIPMRRTRARPSLSLRVAQKGPIIEKIKDPIPMAPIIFEVNTPVVSDIYGIVVYRTI